MLNSFRCCSTKPIGGGVFFFACLKINQKKNLNSWNRFSMIISGFTRDQPEGRRWTAIRQVPTKLVPGGEERPDWCPLSWCTHSFRTEDLEPHPPTASLESGGLKGMGAQAGLVPAGTVLTYWHQLGGSQPRRCWPPAHWLVAYYLAGWLADRV